MRVPSGINAGSGKDIDSLLWPRMKKMWMKKWPVIQDDECSSD